MSAQGERLLAALEAEIVKISKLEHELARAKLLLREQATSLRIGADPQIVMATLRLSVPHETTLALIERIDPALCTPADPHSHAANEGLKSDSGVVNSVAEDHSAGSRRQAL